MSDAWVAFQIAVRFLPVNGLLMGSNFSSATLDDATVALIKRKTRMKTSEITDWFNELKVSASSSPPPS